MKELAQMQKLTHRRDRINILVGLTSKDVFFYTELLLPKVKNGPTSYVELGEVFNPKSPTPPPIQSQVSAL